MSRILLLGMAPLPFEPAPRHHAPGIRSWQLARPLLRAGHRVRLVLRRYEEAYPAGHPARERIPCPDGDGAVELLSPTAFAGEGLVEILDEEPWDAVVGAGIAGAARAAQVAGDRPCWADLLGHTMAEGQAKALLHGDDDLLIGYFQQEIEALVRADAFSVVSRAQRAAVLGELGLAGRLNARTADEVLVHVAPCAALEPGPAPALPHLRGRAFAEDAFVVLWSGGYNTWADVGTLLHGLELAMDALPGMVFVSTGGALEGQDPETYPRFAAAVAASRHRDRFHLRGWTSAGEVASCLAEADCGLNVDRDIPESWLGSRNRIPTFLAHGLRVVSTLGAEVATDGAAAGVVTLVPPGDAPALARALVALGRDRAALRASRSEVAAYAARELSFEATTADLQAWAAAPRRARDVGTAPELLRRLGGHRDELDAKDRRIAALEARLAGAAVHVRNLEALVAEKDLAIEELRAFHRRVTGSLPYRLLAALRGR